MGRSMRWADGRRGTDRPRSRRAAAFVGPSDAAIAHPCTMNVTLNRVSSVTYGNGVERQKYNVKVSWSGNSQSAEVHRMTMPRDA